MKFNLPSLPITAEEATAWDLLWSNKSDAAKTVGTFKKLRDAGEFLSSRAQDLLAMSNEKERQDFINLVRGKPLVQNTVATAMASMNIDRDGVGEKSTLLVATESCQVLILDSNATTVETFIEVPSPVAFIATYGLLKSNHRIVVACRDGFVYTIRDKKVLPTQFQLPALPTSMTVTATHIWTTCADHSLYCWSHRGELSAHHKFKSAATSVVRFTYLRDSASEGVCVGLASGEVHTIQGNKIISTLQCANAVTGLQFGQYGREANCLIVTMKAGALGVYMLRRNAFQHLSSKIGVEEEGETEGDLPALVLPKKTKVALELMEREVQSSTSIHRIFQRSLLSLKTATAREFVRLLETEGGGAAIQFIQRGSEIIPQVRITCDVIGVGPSFLLHVEVSNTGSVPLTDLHIFVNADPAYYFLPRNHHGPLHMLLPSSVVTIEIPVECVHKDGGSDIVHVHIFRGTNTFLTDSVAQAVKKPQTDTNTSEQAVRLKHITERNEVAKYRPAFDVASVGSLVGQPPLVSAAVTFPPCMPLEES